MNKLTTNDRPAERLSPKTLNSTRYIPHPEIEVHGDPNIWVCLCKASNEAEGWMKSTKAMAIGLTVVVQTSTQQRNPDGSYAVSDALCVVPGATIRVDDGGVELVAVVRDPETGAVRELDI